MIRTTSLVECNLALHRLDIHVLVLFTNFFESNFTIKVQLGNLLSLLYLFFLICFILKSNPPFIHFLLGFKIIFFIVLKEFKHILTNFVTIVEIAAIKLLWLLSIVESYSTIPIIIVGMREVDKGLSNSLTIVHPINDSVNHFSIIN